MSEKIIVAGGSGMIGSALAKKLHEKYELILATRSDSIPKELKNLYSDSINTRKIKEGLSDSIIEKNFEGAAAVVNLAGASIAGKRWTAEYKKIIVDSRVETTRGSADAINRCANPPKVFFSASAVGYYGDSGATTLEEDSPPGSDFLAKVCDKWETEARAAEKSTRVVRGRIGVVLSSAGGALPELVRPFKFFVGGPIGSGFQFVPWIHIDDLLNLIVKCIEDSNISGAVNLTAPNPVRNRTLAKAIGDALGRPSLFPVPKFALRILLGESANMVLASQKAIPTKALESGYEFRFIEIENALADLL